MLAFTSRSRQRAAFTLVELLVVIGIIALLISMLIPVLGKAKEAANTVKCLAQQKQLMTAFIMYTTDYKGAVPIPPGGGGNADYYPNGTGVEGRSLMYYMDDRARNVGGWGIARFDVGAFIPYIGKAAGIPSAGSANAALGGRVQAVLNCPSDNDAFKPVYQGGIIVTASYQRNFTYSWNQWLRTDRGYGIRAVAHKISQIKNTAQKVVLIEEAAPNDPICWIFPQDPDDTPAFRHNGKGNFGFADGHCQTLLPGDVGFTTPKFVNAPPSYNGRPGIDKGYRYFFLTENIPVSTFGG